MMIGGASNNTYLIHNAGDAIIEGSRIGNGAHTSTQHAAGELVL